MGRTLALVSAGGHTYGRRAGFLAAPWASWPAAVGRRDGDQRLGGRGGHNDRGASFAFREKANGWPLAVSPISVQAMEASSGGRAAHGTWSGHPTWAAVTLGLPGAAGWERRGQMLEAEMVCLRAEAAGGGLAQLCDRTDCAHLLLLNPAVQHYQLRV